MKSIDELKREGKDPSRGRGYRRGAPGTADVFCWSCARSKKRAAGGRIECGTDGAIVGTLYTCDQSVKA